MYSVYVSIYSLLTTIQQYKKSTSSEKWSDFVEELWYQDHLKCLREVAIPFEGESSEFEFDPQTGLYGYQKYEAGEESEDCIFLQETPNLSVISIKQINEEQLHEEPRASEQEHSSGKTKYPE